MAIAHRLGLKTSVTMMYGIGETLADRIEHLYRVREVQRATRGFTAFICWPLQPENSQLAHLPKTDAVTYLRTQAIARIVLPDVPNIQASWVTMGMKVGQVALRFGANDFGSLMMEENVVSAANTTNRTTLAEMQRLIADAGYTPKSVARTTPFSKTRPEMPDVLIVVGSESDKPRIEPAFEILTKAGVTYEFHASSAHRQPEATGELVKTARAKGFKVVIAGAGLSAALPGFAASLTDLPVIGVPFAVGPLNGLDALLATVQVPRASPSPPLDRQRQERGAPGAPDPRQESLTVRVGIGYDSHRFAPKAPPGKKKARKLILGGVEIKT